MPPASDLPPKTGPSKIIMFIWGRFPMVTSYLSTFSSDPWINPFAFCTKSRTFEGVLVGFCNPVLLIFCLFSRCTQQLNGPFHEAALHFPSNVPKVGFFSWTAFLPCSWWTLFIKYSTVHHSTQPALSTKAGSRDKLPFACKIKLTVVTFFSGKLLNGWKRLCIYFSH